MRVTLVSLKRALDGLILTVLGVVSITLIYRPARLFSSRHGTKITPEHKQKRFFLSLDFPDDGFHFIRSKKEKFLSYEPPIGSWSDQLLSFQNAVIVAALLNRTLLAQPLFSELEGKRLRREVRRKLKSDSEVYKLIDVKFTVPISSVINLMQLSKLLKVSPVKTSHLGFLEHYGNLSWYDVCHKHAAGYWLDFIPSPSNSFAWRILQAQTFVPLKTYFSGIGPLCEQQLEMIDSFKNSSPVLRGILTELAAVQEDVIYFRGGSLATRELRFLSKERTAQAQKWIRNFIQFSPYVLKRITQIVENIQKPYNAVVITPSKNPEIFNNTMRFRLKEMERKTFRAVTNRLYVVTSMNDLSKLKLYLDYGYELYSTRDLIPAGISPHIKYDVDTLLGELICSFARLFEGPVDSYLIQQARVHEARRQDDLLTEHISVKWALHTVKRTFKLKEKIQQGLTTTQPMKDGLRIMFCKICKTMHSRLKNATCRPILSDCKKRKL